jgi:hypothetical protein
MSISNVVKQTDMSAVSQRSWREQWRFYKRCHPLAQEYAAARRGQLGKLTQFVQQCIQPGKVAVIDSFAPAVELIYPVAHWVELDSFATVMAPWAPEIAPGIFPRVTDTYSTVIMLGEQWTKYKTPVEYANTIKWYQTWLQPQGNLIVCMPVTHMIYHRLCYNVEQVLEQINAELPADFKIQQHIKHGLNLYLEIRT